MMLIVRHASFCRADVLLLTRATLMPPPHCRYAAPLLCAYHSRHQTNITTITLVDTRCRYAPDADATMFTPRDTHAPRRANMRAPCFARHVFSAVRASSSRHVMRCTA